MISKCIAWALAALLIVTTANAGTAPSTELAQPALPWNPNEYGNQRYSVFVEHPADAVLAKIDWRRRDQDPQSVETIVISPGGHRVRDVYRLRISQALGEIVFRARVAGAYAIYYQPYVRTGRVNYPVVVYRGVEDTADPQWLKRHGDFRSTRAIALMPRARVIGYQAVDAFDAYTDMERTATPDDIKKLLAASPHSPWLVFPESSAHPIRMFRQIPERWALRGAGGSLTEHSTPGQYVVFQIGLWAARQAASDVRVRFSALEGPDGVQIPASQFTCFNLGGVDYKGRSFTDRLDVSRGHVQPLWMGLAVPERASAGAYHGEVTVSAGDGSSTKVPLTIVVGPQTVAERGAGSPDTLARLRWLNSTVGQDFSLVRPFTSVNAVDGLLQILGRHVRLASSGLPAQISSYFDQRMTGFTKAPIDMLATPVEMIVEDATGRHLLTARGTPTVRVDGPGEAQWRVDGRAGPLTARVDGSLQMDGTLNYSIALTAVKPVDVSDIRLEIPLRPDIAQYEMGLGRMGGVAPARFAWKWNPKFNQEGAWVGTVNAGLEFALRGENYRRPLNTNFYNLRPLLMPRSWSNGGAGGVSLTRTGTQYVISAFSGPRTIYAGQVLHYDLVLRVTPFKPIRPARQFKHRYFQFGGDATLFDVRRNGATVVNVHQGNLINPWINYPYLDTSRLRAFVKDAHAMGMAVKIYDTVRELSDHAIELPALESLTGCRIGADGPRPPPCSEVVMPGGGGGFSWLQEHLDGNYLPGWYTPSVRDAAVVDLGQSRWLNYYVEGVDWLSKKIGIDGLYLDDVAYGHHTMERVRKVLQENRPHPLIDLHSANQFDPRDGYANSALLYMGLFPFIDRLWFGERFDYDNTSPPYWLTEISGIPYGLMGEMLQGGGNPWRGMLFGMTTRLPTDSDEVRSMWRVWDEFGIEKADMIGWWVHDAPVTTGRPDVLVTSYVRKGDKTMIALASWAATPVQVTLHIDWGALGLTRAASKLVAPAITGFQPAEVFRPEQTITVAPGKGWLLVVQ